MCFNRLLMTACVFLLVPFAWSQVHPPAGAAYDPRLTFAPLTREAFESRLSDSNIYRVRHAKAMLKLNDDRSVYAYYVRVGLRYRMRRLRLVHY